jgi:peptidoglycan/xylan/chitin deacetylase (PgdA/CDA1 family)
MELKKQIKIIAKDLVANYFPFININFKLKSRCIFLTFDDGPNLRITPKLLAIMQKENINATFFLVGGNVEKNPEILKQLIKNGHDIGNHTYSHLHLKRSDIRSLSEEIMKTNQIVKQVTGKKTKLFRPPYGEISFSELRWLKKNDFKTMFWSVDFIPQLLEYNNNLKKLASQISNGDVILLHDDDSKVLEILPDFIGLMKEKNYKFCTLSSVVIK